MDLTPSALSSNCFLLYSLIWRDVENQSCEDFGDTLVNTGSTGISERPLTPKHSPVEAAMLGVDVGLMLTSPSTTRDG